MGTLFSPGSILGDTSINGVNYDSYSPDVSIDNPPDASQYTDAGTDPTSGGGGDWAATLGTVVNDAFSAYQIAQTPTAYRAASPGSPAAIAAKAQATQAKTQSTLLMIGGIIVVIVVLYFVFKK